MSNSNILEMIKSLGNGETLDEAIKKEAAEQVTEETPEAENDAEEAVEEEVSTEEEAAPEAAEAAEKEAEETETKEVTEEADLVEKVAAAVVKKLQEKTGSDETPDKVDTLIHESIKEAEEMGTAQEKIVLALFNEFCIEEGEADTDDVVKMAEEEDSPVPYLVDCLYKWAALADEQLGEKFGEDYVEEDVIKLASFHITNSEDPFFLAEAVKAESEEAVVEKEAEEEVVEDPKRALLKEVLTEIINETKE
jgi:hypothetical protein